MGDIRRSGEMLPVFDPTCCKFRCGRAERTTSVGVLLPQACQCHCSDPANATEGVAYFQIAKEE